MSETDKKKKPAGIKGSAMRRLRNKMNAVHPPPVAGTKKPQQIKPSLARKLIGSRVMPSKLYTPKSIAKVSDAKSIVGGAAGNVVGSPASIVELARALKNDVDLIFEHVYNNIEFEPTFGSQKGPVGTLLDGSGNSFDQSELMVALLREAGYTADMVFGELRLTYAQTHDWLGTQEDNLLPAYWYFVNGGIPVDVPWVGPGEEDYVFDCSHCWVRVDIDSTYYYFDPSIKEYEEVEGIDLATAMSYNQTAFMTDATDGATQTADYLEDINRTNIRDNLATLTGNLVDYIRANEHGASMDEIVGGRRIVPQSGQVRWTEHPYLKPETEVDIWEFFPPEYHATLRVQYDTIDETFRSREIYGKRLTLFFNGSHEAELRLDGDLVATSDPQGTNTWSAALLTATHPYSWADQYAYYRIWADQYYLIANGWGTAGRGMVEEHRRRLDQARFDGGADSDEDVLGETLSVQWYTLNGLGCRNGDIIDRMTNCRTVYHHQIGVVGYFDTPSMDISMVVAWSSNLDLDWDAPNVAATAAAMHGVANEAATVQQTSGIEAVSTCTLVDVAADAGQKIYYADSSNWTADVEPYLTNYDSGTKTDIENNWINNGYRVILPEDGEVTLASWEGFAYYVIPPYPYSGAIGIIGGGLKGTNGGALISLFNMNKKTVDAGQDVNGIGGYLGVKPKKKSKDPIGMWQGNCTASNTDITVGSAGAPYGLAFTRHYNSASRRQNGVLGLGWQHNFDVSVAESSDGFLTLGDATPMAAAAGIVEMFVAVDLCSDLSKPLDKLLTVAIANDWLVDQMTNNTVILSGAEDSDIFVKLPDGSYVSSRGDSSVLELDGTLKVTSAQGVVANFNGDGKIESIVYPFGMTTSFTYNTGKLTEVSTSLGRSLSFYYDGDKLDYITDGNSRTVEFHFTGENLTSVTDPEGKDTQFEYAEPGLMSRIYLPEHPLDEVVTNNYDSLGRVYEQLDAFNNPWTYYFAGARSEEVAPNGKSRIFYFDRFGNVLRTIDALGKEVKKEYDGVNRLVRVTMPEENQVERTYDSKNNLLELRTIAKPGSGLTDLVRTFTYDPDWNQVASAEDARSNTTTYEYDSLTGQLLHVEFPEVDSEVPELFFTYTANGQIESKTDPTGVVTQFAYSNTNETLESVVVNPGMGALNLTTLFGYDDVGNVNSVTDPRGNETVSEWDSRRMLELVTAPTPFGHQTAYDYDDNGNCLSVSRSTGDVMNPWQVFATAYDKENKVESTTDPMSHVVSYGYDTLRRLESVEDPELRVTETAYDDANRPATVEDPADNIAVTNTYTDNGKLESVSDARTKQTLYEYNGFDRLVKITYADTTFEEFDWDENGNLLSFVNRNGDEIVFEYDELNRLRVKTPDNQPVVTITYDLAGRLKTISTPVVTDHPESGEYEFFYDTAGRLTSEEMPDSKTVGYDLDENGNVIKVTYPDSYYVEREYDELNRLKSITLNGAMAPALEFSYDDLSRRTQIAADNTVVTDYHYRDDNRVDWIEHTFDGSSIKFEYDYNDAGELISQQVDDAGFMWHPASSGTVAYGTASDVNTYPTVDSISQSFNANGCLTGDGTWTFGYDTENHLISADDGVTSVAYMYDPMHRQIQREVDASKTRYVYGFGAQRLADYDGSNDTLQCRYVYGTGLDEVLLRVDNVGAITYMHADRLGSIVATSDNSGANTDKYAYGPFGETDSLSGITQGYTGQRFDSETGLYYMKSRYYLTNIGRFLQPDPTGYMDGLNLYTYVHNKPLDFIDPLGTETSGTGIVQHTYWESWDLYWSQYEYWEAHQYDWASRHSALGWNAFANPKLSSFELIETAHAVPWNGDDDSDPLALLSDLRGSADTPETDTYGERLEFSIKAVKAKILATNGGTSNVTFYPGGVVNRGGALYWFDITFVLTNKPFIGYNVNVNTYLNDKPERVRQVSPEDAESVYWGGIVRKVATMGGDPASGTTQEYHTSVNVYFNETPIHINPKFPPSRKAAG